MTQHQSIPLTFSYEAQTADTQPLSGTIDPSDAATATARLESLGLRVMRLDPSAPPPRPKSLRGDDFLAFNRPLAQLTAPGMPVEHGLRLIARDMRSGRLSATLQQVATDLEKGMFLPEALDRNRAKFPPLYARLVDAGVRANNLPAMLLNLGRHLEMVQRLRALLWRSFSYPLLVLVGLIGVMAFLGVSVPPQFAVMFAEFKIHPPAVTRALLAVTHVMG